MTELVAIAYVNHGRWVADCPHPDCHSAEHYQDPYNGKYGGLRPNAFHCTAPGGCGLSYPVVWPPNIAEIERWLVMRPIMTTRNWLPGETIADLVLENAEHGCIPLAELAALPAGKVFQVVDDQVELSAAAVAAGMGRLELGA